MRVIAGSARSLPLKTPKGMETRPTQDRIKETLFNILQDDLPGCVFVDLFAGSGGIGIEALSRGAAKAYFVDNGREPALCIEENLRFTKLFKNGEIIKSDVLHGLQSIAVREKQADIIFMDPPYGKALEKAALELLSGMSLCGPDTLIIIESLLKEDFSYLEDLGFCITRVKEYKTNQHVFIKRAREDV